jgi:hypothetical protein
VNLAKQKLLFGLRFEASAATLRPIRSISVPDWIPEYFADLGADSALATLIVFPDLLHNAIVEESTSSFCLAQGTLQEQ